MAASTHELATASGVHDYLANTEFACTSAVPLAGGVGNFTYRLFLSNPHKERSTLILKHAKPYVALSPDFPFSVDRQVYESRALTEVRKSGICNALVTVPEVIHHDTTANFLVLEDCGEQTLNLKQLMLTAHTDTPRLLKRPPPQNITAMITYGRLIRMLTTHKIPAIELLPDPISDEDLDSIRAIVEERTAEIHAAKTSLTMGDFWTGNVIVANIIDWELAKPGVLALDVSQFCAEVHCISVFKPEKADSANALIRAFLTEYRAHCGDMEDNFAGTAAKHLGAHLVTIAPTVGWGTPEESVKAVEEGLMYLQEGCSAKWLRERSIFAPLVI
ncbi:kinase-like domain-containing protein [Mycena amicta]|nr:kinase-like domain-containing protein [Mycena amicta]